MNEWYRDGVRVTEIPIDDRAVQYGDGLFETVAVRHAKPRLWSLHADRLHRGCVRLGIEPPEPATLGATLQAAIDASDIDTSFCVAKVVVSAGAGERGYGRSASAQPTILIGLHRGTPLKRQAYVEGIDATLCELRLARQPRLAGIKSLNRLEQVLARTECDRADAFEGLLRDTDGRLICGTMSNVFVVHENTIATPDLSEAGVEGVMRAEIMRQLKQNGHGVVVRDIDAAEIRTADEMFISNSQFGIVPVRCVDSTQLAVGKETRRVMSLLAAHGVHECAP